jgi:acetolactate synthase-1/2/3 large subunit
MSHFFRSKEPGTVFCPGGVAGMGWGPPAALAAKMLYPERPVVSVSGDGGFVMMSHVLSTAVQYHLAVSFVVMNNSALGMIHDSQRERIVASEFASTDFAAIARAYGCCGATVTDADALGPAIEESLKAPLPTVIDVATSLNESHFKIASL